MPAAGGALLLLLPVHSSRLCSCLLPAFLKCVLALQDAVEAVVGILGMHQLV